jgi:uncharacterized membrane protein YccC
MTGLTWTHFRQQQQTWRTSLYRSLPRSNARNRRSRHALKTTVAVVLATLIFAYSDVQTRLLAGVAAAFLMQCVDAGPRGYQRRCMLFSALVMAAEAFVGPMLSGHKPLKYGLLVAVAYGVVQARRRLRAHNGFPLFLFTFCVLTTGLPGGIGHAWGELAGVACGLLLAYTLYFHVDYQHETPDPAAKPGVRTGLRTAVAALLAVAIASVFALPRAYWAILTAVVLVSETWRESAKKAFQRVGMTILGCIIAWALHFPTAHLPHVTLGLMFLFVYLAVHFRTASYPLMTFFITLYVAFLFAVLGQWTLQILAVRIYETAIGGGTALVAAFLVRPLKPLPEPAAKTAP